MSTELAPRTQAEGWLRSPQMREQIMASLPFRDAAAKERFIHNLATVCRTDPKLAKCDQRSVLEACIQAAQLGLEMNTPLRQSTAVPFGDKATLMIEYRGLADLMRRSGLLKRISTGIVRQNDRYKRTATGFEFECDPFAKEEERGPIVGAFAVLDLSDGTQQVETMSMSQIEHIRAKSRAAKSGPWVQDWEEMARKTVLRRAAKLLPWSAEDAGRIELADRTEFQELDAEVEIREPEAPQRGVQALRERLAPAPAAQPPQDDTQEPEPVPTVPLDSLVDPGANQRPPVSMAARSQAAATEATTRLPLGRDLPIHQEDAATLCAFYGFKPWDRWTSGRQLLVAKTMKDLGIESASGFWGAVHKALTAAPESAIEAIGTLEDAMELVSQGTQVSRPDRTN